MRWWISLTKLKTWACQLGFIASWHQEHRPQDAGGWAESFAATRLQAPSSLFCARGQPQRPCRAPKQAPTKPGDVVAYGAETVIAPNFNKSLSEKVQNLTTLSRFNRFKIRKLFNSFEQKPFSWFQLHTANACQIYKIPQRASFWQPRVLQCNLNTLLSRQHVICLTPTA